MAVGQKGATSPHFNNPLVQAATLPVPPVLDLAEMNMGNLALLLDFFDALSAAALGIANQPRCENEPAGAYIEAYWGWYLNGLRDSVVQTVEARRPPSRADREMRAQIIIHGLVMDRQFAEAAELAGRMAELVG